MQDQLDFRCHQRVSIFQVGRVLGSVCFESLEALTAFMNPIENNGAVGEGMMIAGWNGQNFLEMFH